MWLPGRSGTHGLCALQGAPSRSACRTVCKFPKMSVPRNPRGQLCASMVAALAAQTEPATAAAQICAAAGA
eukprot:7043857-Prymnesium_polylepis.1